MKISFLVVGVLVSTISTAAIGQNSGALAGLLQPFVRAQLLGSLCEQNNPGFLAPFGGEPAFLENIRHVHTEIVTGLSFVHSQVVLAIGVDPTREEARRKLRSFEVSPGKVDELGIRRWCETEVLPLIHQKFQEHVTNHDEFLKTVDLNKKGSP